MVTKAPMLDRAVQCTCMWIVTYVVMVAEFDSTVEPLYNGHFGTSHFWVIFALI